MRSTSPAGRPKRAAEAAASRIGPGRVERRRSVEVDQEGREAPRAARDARVAAIILQADQVLDVDLPLAPQLGEQVGGVLGAGVEDEEAADVVEDDRAQRARAAVAGPDVEPGERLGGEDDVGPVLGQPGEQLLVVGTGHQVELVDEQGRPVARGARLALLAGRSPL